MSHAPTDALPKPGGAPLRLKLLVVSGPDFGAELQLEQGTYRVGKEPGVDLRLTDPAVSRTHLVIEVLPHAIRVSDNQSTNGATYQGQRFTSLELTPPAVVRIGKTDLKLVPAEEGVRPVPPSEQEHFGSLLGKSLVMRQLFGLLKRVAENDMPVLIVGETGTGKELCAQAVHQASARAQGPFVVCDVAALTPNLAESELFGHVKGAFTGADAPRAGVFERAHDGTLFLDEIGELPLELQPRLLRALEARSIKRVGGNQPHTFNTRVLAATHRDLLAEVRAGRFREDLYHRLAVLKVALPPLRERVEDLPLLIDDCLSQLQMPKDALSANTRAMFAGYGWPGNVRELKNAISRAVSLGVGLEPEASTSAPRPSAPAGAVTSAVPFKDAKDGLVAAFERDYLKHLLEAHQGNITHASKAAGITRVYLQRLLKKHALVADSE
ncbi:MAG: sigma 54-interacting transcriptional regulator [Archangiaceae bacterium]|nr:sigma 54-interacting transcriptional regulator [Archangiaceae bacterium]